ncbi:unnamed protein product [Porites evermanni]|uniref:Uncharacterized protein n=1 Tax=Porites evermanni TaxID=104178 RepID=A0ABN8LKV2_9CNID|nr:unnamed protein product [Porites evermanni]
MSLADKSMKSSERFSVGLFSKGRPVHRSREATDDPIVKERVERVPGTFLFSIPGRENVVCSRTPTVDRLREERAKKELVFRYTAPDGETVAIPRIVEPYKSLHVNQNASRAEIKSAFLRVANHSRRQDRAMASLSYNILLSKIPRYRKIRDDCFEVTQRTDVILLAVVGATASLVAQISKNSSLASTTDEYKHSLLYVTARSGFYDTTEALLEMGVPVNEKQVDGSTALHAASFYGQQPVVELLLRHGADPTVTNKWRHSPADEANSREIKQIILSYKEDRISQIVSSLVGKSLAFWVRLIKYNGTVIAKEARAENVIILLRYTAPDGGTGTVPRIVNPYHVFQLNQNATIQEIKEAFKRTANQSQRQGRVMASLSYHILMSNDQRYRKVSDGYYEIAGKTDVIVLAVVGATASLVDQISKNSSLASTTDEHKHSLLYVAARAGFYDTTEALLKMGVPVNEKQVDGSTALHAASFYRQQLVVEILLRHGADPTITNKWGNSPADEASSEIKQIILSYKEDRISQIVSSLVGKGLAFLVRLINHKGTIVAKEVRAENVIILLRYTVPGGGTGTLPRIVNPYHVFQLNQHTTIEEVKQAFKRAANLSQRQGRVMASLSYHILMSKDQ